MIFHFQLKFNLVLKFNFVLKFLLYSLGVKSWCFSCDKMDWAYKFCAVMNVVTISILCFFRCAQRDITEWTLIHMLLIKIIWFTWYLWISLLDGFCLTSIQGHSRYWSDSCGEGYKVFSFHWCLTRNQNLEISWTSEHQHTIPDICHGSHGYIRVNFFLAGVNFYRFNAKNWHFRQILREKVAFFLQI